MPVDLLADSVSTTVSSGGTDAPSALTVESFTVASSTGWPAASSGASPPTQFRFVDFADTNKPPEVMACTNVLGTTWTVTRGIEGHAPWTHTAGFTIVPVLTAAGLPNLPAILQNLTVFNVMAYGATGNGTTDDTAACQAAIVAAGAVHGTAYFPQGTYKVSAPLQIGIQTTLWGVGQRDVAYGSHIIAAAGSNLSAVVCDVGWVSGASPSNGTCPRIVGLLIDGNGTNQTGTGTQTGIGIAMMAWRAEIRDCVVVNCRGDGIRLTDTNAAGNTIPISGQCGECRVVDNVVYNVGLGALASNHEGIAVRDANTNVTDYFICRNLINPQTTPTCASTGIWANLTSGAFISENHIYGAGAHGIWAAGGSFFRVVNNYCEYWGMYAGTGAVHGIHLVGDGGGGGIVVSGNTLHIDSPVSGNTFTGIYLTNSSGIGSMFAVGPNSVYSPTAADTGMALVNIGNVANYLVALAPQMMFGMTKPYALGMYSWIIGTPFSGWQAPAYASSMSVDPTLGTNIFVSFGAGNVAMDLPVQVSAGMKFTLIFMQDSVGSRTVTWTNSGGVGGGSAVWAGNTAWQPTTAANSVSTVDVLCDGWDLWIL